MKIFLEMKKQLILGTQWSLYFVDNTGLKIHNREKINMHITDYYKELHHSNETSRDIEPNG